MSDWGPLGPPPGDTKAPVWLEKLFTFQDRWGERVFCVVATLFCLTPLFAIVMLAGSLALLITVTFFPETQPWFNGVADAINRWKAP